MIYHVTLEGRTITVEVDGRSVSVDGRTIAVDLEAAGSGGVRSLLLDRAAHRVAARSPSRGRWQLQLGAAKLNAEVVDERTRVIRSMTGRGSGTLGPRPIVAPMPGMVVRVELKEGDRVEAGQGVVIVEAMKMENELVAEGPGIVERVHVAQGDAVEKDQLLVSLSPIGGDEPEGAETAEGR